jgi:hypothetical protein
MSNWKTTWSGIASAITSALTLIALAPTELGDVATIIPPEWKARVVAAGLIATFILRVIKSVSTADAKAELTQAWKRP